MNGMNRSFIFPAIFCRSVLLKTISAGMVFGVFEVNASWLENLTLYPTKVDAVISYERTDNDSSGDKNHSSRETQSEAGARISQQGHVLDPGIAWFLLNFEPTYTRDEFDSDTLTEDSSGDILNYLFQLGLLRDTPDPFSYDLTAQRISNNTSGSLGSLYDNVIDSKQVAVNWKTKAFPMSFIYKEEILEQDFRTIDSNLVSKRDEVLQTWSITGRSSKLNLRLQHKTLDDRITTRNNDHQLDQAILNHQLPWGRDSELRSRFDFYDRTGFNANERLTVEEIARIRHTDNLFSRSSLRFNSVTQSIKTEEKFAKFELNHQLYSNLTSTASMNVKSRESENLDEQSKYIDLDSRYQKQNFYGALVNAGLGVGYKETDRESSVGLISIADESHVTTLSGTFTLNNRFILSASIIVISDDGTLVYVEGIDYEVNSLSGDLTEILTIPGSRINEGDTLLVSYQASALPSQEFSTTQTRYNLGFDLGWFQFSHMDRRSDDTLKSGADESFLNDSRNTVTNLLFRWKVKGNDFRVGAERRYILAGGFDSTIYTYQQSLSWLYSSKTQLNLTATEAFTEQELRDTDLYSLDLSLDLKPYPGMTVRPTLGYWKRQDKDGLTAVKRDDEFISAGFRLHWKYRKVDMNFSYFHNQRDINIEPDSKVRSEEDRVMFKLTRRFL